MHFGAFHSFQSAASSSSVQKYSAVKLLSTLSQEVFNTASHYQASINPPAINVQKFPSGRNDITELQVRENDDQRFYV